MPAWAARAAAAASLALASFGDVPAQLEKRNPWRGFHAADPVLLSVRAQKLSGASCRAWLEALAGRKEGARLGARPDLKAWAEAARQWEPWSERELEEIRDCEDLPCDIKLDAKEVERMNAAPEAARLGTFLKLVEERASRYSLTQERKEYEFKGDPMDPWIVFEKEGLKTALPRPARPDLWARKVRLDAEKAKTIHQILDRRVSVSEAGDEAVSWIRDAYTDHFFDGWGEWEQVRCEGGAVRVVQAVSLEFDLLKKTDLISKLMRGKMRSGVEDQAEKYLDRRFQDLADRAKAAKGPGL